jgi:hypothetical protein
MKGSGRPRFAAVCLFQSWQRHAHAEELGFRDFTSFVPGEGESPTAGKLCVLHFFYRGSDNSRAREPALSDREEGMDLV